MTLHLNDIIDLDYLLNIDDQRDSGEQRKKTLARDREIFTQINKGKTDPEKQAHKKETHKKEAHKKKGDSSLILSWLEYRRLVFFHEADGNTHTLLPGTVFSSLYSFCIYLLVITGFLSGISMVYSFLAYHGARPINVTIFFFVFIFIQVLLFGLTFFWIVRQFVMEKTGNTGHRPSIVQTLLSDVFFRGLPKIFKMIHKPVDEKKMEAMEYIASLIRMRRHEYSAVFFWPFFILSSIFAASFSAGALGGTLFRVAVSDMAFGWQSTLMTASTRIHGYLSIISLPWSWFVENKVAHPTLEQIEGSRILLKEGISTLATKDLVSWWPFLCFGLLFYAVLPRLILIMASFMAQKKAMNQYDFERPRFKKLMIRMQSPVMDIRFTEAPVTGSGTPSQSPHLVSGSFEPDSYTSGSYTPDSYTSGGPGPETISAEPTRSELFRSEPFRSEPFRSKPSQSKPFRPGASRSEASRSSAARVLVPGSVYGTHNMGEIESVIHRQLFFDVHSILPITFDFETDREQLLALTAEEIDQIIVLQEVWQPPIRGLLYYFVQLKTEIFKEIPLWILLTQTPGEENPIVDGEDINFKVWKRAIQQLGNPDILVERVHK